MIKGFSKVKKNDSKSIQGIGGQFKKISDYELNLKKKLFHSKGFKFPTCDEAFVNNQYCVMVFNRFVEMFDWGGEIKHLVIKPADNKPIRNHWKTLQAIKNEICGTEQNAIEIYPKESTLIDEANVYHLWVFPESFELSFGIHLPGWF